MNWVGFLKAVLGFASALTEYLRNRELLEAGEAQAIAEGLKNANEAIEKARRARRNAVRDFDKRDGGPDGNDPNLRD